MHRQLSQLMVWALSALLASCTGAGAATWERLDRLADVRLDASVDLTAQLRESPVIVDLPWPATIAGERTTSVVVGPGWVGASGDGPRLNVLSGAGVSLDAGGQARALVAPDGVAIRWAGLSTPRGKAVAELLISPSGQLTVQYLAAPAGLDNDARAGRILAGLPSQPLAPQAATAWTMRDAARKSLVLAPRIEPRLPADPALPTESGPPPAGCSPETMSWCDRADGVGASTIYIQQSFDGRADIGGPWFTRNAPGLANQWHLTPWGACPPGASGSSGQSAYHGDETICSYGSRTGGSLISSPVGPIAFGTQLVFSSRMNIEEGFDIGEIRINGDPFRSMPTGMDANTWYDFRPLDLSAYAGQTIEVEFYFESDNSVEAIGWFIDDVIVWSPDPPGEPDCIRNAGLNDFEPCNERVSTQWDFNESRFCTGCPYTFYVLVECGREMHLPLNDMEGADFTVTNVITGQPMPLRCVNETARADAGLGSYSGQYAPDVNGAPLDCCAGGGPEIWWGPAFDETDNAGPGHVRWGLDDGCPNIMAAYDANGNDGLECSELPPTCGGLAAALSPGDEQIMDCFIADDAGLCGLYRVDVISGGFVWSLFANCDGTGTPQFQIFHDCTEAWTAYNPLPELAISNLTTASGCPNLDVSFDVVNIGCTDFLGDVPIRITSNCVPQDVLDTTIPGPLRAGGSISATIPFVASCSPVRVEVFADPDDIVPECTESLTVAACRTVAGVDSLATFTCGCTAQLAADAGADVAACVSTRLTLDGSGSSIAPCAQPEYRWLDASGGVVRDWSATPTVSVVVAGCPSGREYTLEIRCAGEACVETDTVRVDCIVIAPNAGPDVRACVGTPVTLDGSASTISNCANPEYRWIDELGFEIRPWNPSPITNLGPLTCADAGTFALEARCASDPFCAELDEVTVSCVEVIADAGPDLLACEDVPFLIDQASSTSTGCLGVVYAWFDAGGGPLTPFGPDPTFAGTLTGCPGGVTLVFVAACNEPGLEDCGTFDTVDVICPRPEPPIPTAAPGCGRTNALDCGVAEAGVTYSWDLDVSVDSDANTIPDDDADLAGCAGVPSWPASGQRTIRSWAVEPASGCASFTDILVEAFDDPAPPMPSAAPACPGRPSSVSCGTSDPALTYSWDADIAVDSDGNTVADDDDDATTCDAEFAYASGLHVARLTVTDARSCTASATADVDVPTSIPPGEVQDDRVARSGAAVTFSWSAVAGASDYRISRGDIGTWYSHAADDAAGKGACFTGAATSWTDADDGADAGDYYYLITAVEPCGAEGSPGNRFDRQSNAERDPRIPSGVCP